MKINYPLVLPPVIFVIVCAAAIMFSQLLSDKPLSASDIHGRSSEMASYTRESATLLREFEKDHLTPTYLIEQLKQIQKQYVSIADELSNAQLSVRDEKNVLQLLDLSENYSKDVRTITRSPQKSDITKVLADLEKQTTQLDTITKSYE